MKRALILVSLVLGVSSCATGPMRVLSPKEGISDEQTTADVKFCSDETKNVTAGGPATPYYNPSAGAAGMVGASIGAGFAKGMADGAARREALEACLLSKGHLIKTLTAEQEAKWKSLPIGEERVAYIRSLDAAVADAPSAAPPVQ